MHICVLMSTKLPPEEGIGNHVYNTSRKLIERGHRVTVMTRGDWRGTAVEELEGMRIFRVRFFGSYPFHVHLHAIFVARLFGKLEPEFDVLHAHSPLVPALKTSVPVVTTVHTPMKVDARYAELVNPLAFAMRLHTPVSYWLEQKLLAASDLVTTVSRSVAEELAEYGLQPGQIEELYNGVDTALFIPSRDERHLKDRYVLYVGRLAYRKGLFDFVRCAKLVCEMRPNVRFLVAGKGPIESSVRLEIRKSRMDENITLLGHLNSGGADLVRLYQGATVYVQPSHYEGLPITLLEAMACGLPVVATAVSGNVEVISSGNDGLLVPPGSPERMAEAVLRLLEDRALGVELGTAARRTVEERFTWDAVVDRVLSCYDKVLRGQ